MNTTTTNTDAASSHPKGLYLLFFTEMWERFSYYGMRAILMLYMTKALLYDKDFASGIYGNYTGLVYLTPLIGGYISDRYWGNRKSIIVGGIVMAIGQFFLFLSASLRDVNWSTAGVLFFLGLLALVIGNGFFKPNISTMVNSLYPPNDKRIDAAFSIFYMGINLGAFFSPLVCGTLAEKFDYKWGFLAACIGMLIGLLIFVFLKDKYVITSTGEPIGGKPTKKLDTELDSNPKAQQEFDIRRVIFWVIVYVALLFLFYFVVPFTKNNFVSTIIFGTSIPAAGFIITDPTLTKAERTRITVIYIIAFFVIFFWAAFEQAGASLTLFADRQTDRMIFGWEMPASYFQSVNPLAIIVFAPLFAVLWTKLGQRNMEPPSPLKQAIGLFLLSMGYLVIAFGVKGVTAEQKVSMFWLFSMYILHTLGELCLSPIGLSMVAKLAPARLASLLMGVWFMSTAMANDFAGMLSKLYPIQNPETGIVEATHFLMFEISNAYEFFMVFVLMSGLASVILFFLNKKLVKMMEAKD
ncbi:MAG: MFS transporter [Bacteroidia bacterium]|nr:MAG: MFS transporter [Bacteroidia bacterium]